MAAPSFVSAGTGVVITTGSSTVSKTATVDNLLILQVLNDGGNLPIPSISSVTNIENLAGMGSSMTVLFDNSVEDGNVGNPKVAFQVAWIGRATGTSASVSLTNNSGDDLYARFYEFSGVNTGATLADVIEETTAGNMSNGAGTSTTVSDTGVTTLGADRLACNFGAINDDATGIAVFTGMTGGTWTDFQSFESSTGTDGTIFFEDALPGSDRNTQYETNDTESAIGRSAAIEMAAQSFQVPVTGTIGSVEILLAAALGTPTDGLTADIQTDSAGVPSGSSLGSAIILSPTVSAWNVFSFSSPISLTTGTSYWLVISRTGSLDNANAFFWRGSVANGYASGVFKNFGGGSWATSAMADADFRVRGANVAGTINGGSDTITSDAWGVVGFALIPVAAAPSEPGPPLRVTLQATERSSVW